MRYICFNSCQCNTAWEREVSCHMDYLFLNKRVFFALLSVNNLVKKKVTTGILSGEKWQKIILTSASVKGEHCAKVTGLST